MSSRPDHGRQVVLAGLLFALSGAAALVYQVIWQRILALHSGVGLYSVTMIVAAFLAGLGLGSHLGGVASARVSSAAALRAFVWLEILLGVMGAASPTVYYDWLYPLAAPLPSPSWQGGLLHFVALMPPTCLMGASLPLLVRATVAEVEEAGRTVGLLYGFNVLGAALGAAMGTWLLMPMGGIRGAAAAAALLNVAVGVSAFALLRVAEDQAADADSPAPSPGTGGGRRLGAWLALYALSGFVALSLEILWFRLADVAVKSTAFTFGTVLAVYLLGNAAGSLFMARRVGRLQRPLWLFLMLQCGLLIYAAGVLVLFGHAPLRMLGLGWFVEYWRQYGFFALGHEWDPGNAMRLYVLLPFALFGPSTLLMGAAFPVLQRAVHDDPRTSGRKVGSLQAANILGCVAGTLLVGLLGLHTLGTTGSLRLLVIVGLVFAGAGLRSYGRAFVAPAVALLLLAIAMPGQDHVWRRLHGVRARAPAFVHEDATGVVALTPERGSPGQRWRLSINGKGNSWLPYGGVHTLLGAVPVVLHPAPRDVAIVGLGSGDTAWAAAARADVHAITVFELSSPQRRLLQQVSDVDDLPEVGVLLGDARARIVVSDGRKALLAGRERYDVIEADAQYPSAAYSGHLYSVEFFEIGARRLAPGGLMCAWTPTPRIRASFRHVFRHVVAVGGGDVLVGSNEPIPWAPDIWQERLHGIRAYLGDERYGRVARALRRVRPLPAPAAPGPDVNRDLFPRDEFAAR